MSSSTDYLGDPVYFTLRRLTIEINQRKDLKGNLQTLLTTDFPAPYMIRFRVRQFIIDLVTPEELKSLRHQVLEKLHRFSRRAQELQKKPEVCDPRKAAQPSLKRPSSSEVPEAKRSMPVPPTTVPQSMASFRIPKKEGAPIRPRVDASVHPSPVKPNKVNVPQKTAPIHISTVPIKKPTPKPVESKKPTPPSFDALPQYIVQQPLTDENVLEGEHPTMGLLRRIREARRQAALMTQNNQV